MIYTHNVKVDYLVDSSSDGDKSQYRTKIPSLRCNIQPASHETVILHEANMGELFTMYAGTTASGVRVGDKITVLSQNGFRAGTVYLVKGLTDNGYGGPIPHYEYVLFKTRTDENVQD